jgi:hypothetical protein
MDPLTTPTWPIPVHTLAHAPAFPQRLSAAPRGTPGLKLDHARATTAPGTPTEGVTAHWH